MGSLGQGTWLNRNVNFRMPVWRFFVVFSWCLIPACRSAADHSAADAALVFPDDRTASADFHAGMETLTRSIMEDILSPPVAGRVYAYASLAGWETWCAATSSEGSLLPRLPEAKPLPPPPEDMDAAVASMQAFLSTAKALVFTEDFLAAFEREWLNGLPGEEAIASSRAYGQLAAEHIIRYAQSDRYPQTRTMTKHPEPEDPGSWSPTPPLFMGGLEPHWNKLRPFTLDSASQFAPPTHLPYSDAPNSPFMALVKEVHETAANLTPEQEAIARFWDCNPYVTEEQAHLMPGIKKITPGGHWMAIAGHAARQSRMDYPSTLRAYTLTAIALHDAFISCWDEKYRSNLVRPETVINRSMDPNWKPLLETPPFPEYPSGHSVVSSSATQVLTQLFGPDFAFTDSTELQFGLQPRSFSSFEHAAREASLSRLYGGIHYKPAVELGVVQGMQVGRHVWQKLSAPSETPEVAIP